MSVTFPPPPEGGSNVVKGGGFKQWLLDLWGSVQDVLTAFEEYKSAQGVWQDYIPSFSGLTIGDGTYQAQWCRIGDVVFYRVYVLFGSTTAVTDIIDIGVPVLGIEAEAYLFPMGSGLAKTSGATGSNVRKGACANGVDGDGRISRIRPMTSGSGTGEAWNATTPHTWAAGYKLGVAGWYPVPPA